MKLNTSPHFKKGEMFIDTAGWLGIITEGTHPRAKNPSIINCVEIWGFEHEMGSKYTNEVVYRLTEEEFNKLMKEKGLDPKNRYFKGKLIEPTI